ncbi:16S rRNA (adenine(1518)-N(6)/adenine(1519)-N(6))-dimethyltransferase RsmA [Rhabdaerophilum calidifontis]|uniref:16S rRNA (adenine(1518)-N(6)/adenine(1519)-N(6))- dimethyltransferase RsmA n=1 Tax=Rhabdaerophilum calidifontis TaxID=2604328 RepID=UPI00123C70BB|nr:16S rRNA (adenine(1518)-N(6)/adenine(1519)-N(6))-dimethyltransferase RsmA [Rhabdaerophilum calidifontis]
MIDALPPLREVIRAHGLEARKSLGQNFLLDLNLTAKIARLAGPLAEHVVVEIGPGPGGLTRALLAAGAAHVIAVERDPRCIGALEAVAAAYPGRLTLVEADALAWDPRPLLAGRRARIVANLPYNIGTQLLIGWLRAEPWPPFYDSMTLMFQREVARRIIATPASPEEYGRLAILANWRCETRVVLDLPPAAFTPPPKVSSSVVSLVPRAAPAPCLLTALERVTMAAFAQRRKMLRQSLKSLGPVPALLAAAGLDGSERPETLPIAAFLALANALALQG